MPEVVFYPQNKSINVEEEPPFFRRPQCRSDNRVPVQRYRNLRKCKVRLDEKSLPNVLAKSRHYLSKEEEEQGYVLACETQITGTSRLNLAKTSKMALSKY